MKDSIIYATLHKKTCIFKFFRKILVINYMKKVNNLHGVNILFDYESNKYKSLC